MGCQWHSRGQRFDPARHQLKTAIALVYIDFPATLCDLCLNSFHYLRIHHRCPGYLSGYSVRDEIIKVARFC